MEKYDEDLYENPFFIALQNQFTVLYEEVSRKRWTICVPRYSSIVKETITEEDVRDHIISPDDDDDDDDDGGGEDLKTWSGHVVTVSDGKIELTNSAKKGKAVSILFEETFYNGNDESYRVLCVEQMLNRDQKTSEKPVERRTYNLYSYQECISRLFGHNGGKRTQDSLDRQLESFAGSYPRLASAKLINIVDAAHAHFTKAMQTMLKDSYIRRNAQESETDMFDLKLAVELYMMNFLHRPMFQAITTNVSAEDAEVNKMARNLTDIKPTHLGVKAEFSGIVKLTKKELMKLNSFSTPFGRLRCLKRMVNCLNSSSSTSESKEETLVMTTDDFLPIMIYLIIKSEIPNWTANLMYMKLFHFSKCYQDDEYMFYLTTIEAALDYIKSGRLQQEALKSYTFKQSNVKSDLHRQTSGGATTDRFFQFVQSGDESAVRLLLGKPQDSDVTLQLCHPLCDCSKCRSLLKQRPTEQNLVTAYTRDDRGYTALHIASLHGQAHLVDLLIQHGAVVDASDYLGLTPLHLACRNGYQNIILLLIHFGADCTLTDGVGNTPLHVCVDSGHEDCVKALVFTDKARTKIDINAQNLRGDTPIHLAAKWGYETIIMILLENNADTSIRNRKKQLPINLAQNSNVIKIFRAHDKEPKIDIVKENTESLTEYQVGRTGKPRPSSISFQAPKSPTLVTPVVASLDQEEKRQVDLLFRAIENQDIPLVYYYLKLNADGEEEECSKALDISSMCHPLCTCDKCSNLQQSGPAETPLHVNVRNRSGYTPLHKAAQGGSLELVSLFVRKGAQVNVTNHKQVTPLHIACYFAQTEICSFLLTQGADPDAKDMMGDTPLHLSSLKCCDNIVDLLLKYCAKVNTTNHKGNSPLHNAVRVGRMDIVTKLLNAGAYTLSRNKEDLTPFDFTKNPEIRDLLNSHITKSPIPRSLSDPSSPQYGEEGQMQSHFQVSVVASRKSEEPISIKDLFAAFEEKDLQTLRSLADSIKTFDAKENLKKTETKDTSGPNLRPIQHSLSIQRFDLSALRHVQSQDKSDPMHIYNLSVRDSEQGTNKSEDMSLPDVIVLSSDETVDSPTNYDEDWVLPDIVGHSCVVTNTAMSTLPQQRGSSTIKPLSDQAIISDCDIPNVTLSN